jgi:hypothetical protein
MKQVKLLFLFMMAVHKMFATDSLLLIKSIPIQAQIISTDKSGNIYCAKKNNAIYRYNNNGDSTGYFSAVTRGEISQIDATNPMRVMVFYKDVPQLVFLDRMMTAKSSVDLKQMKIYDCPAVSYSADGLTWAYHTMNTELVKIDDDAKISVNSFNFLQLFKTNVQPIFITEQERTLFIIDTILGILKFDQFGNYQTTYHFFPKELQYINNQLIFYYNGELINYNIKTIQERKLKLANPESIINARVERNRLYVLRKESLDIYVMKE